MRIFLWILVAVVANNHCVTITHGSTPPRSLHSPHPNKKPQPQKPTSSIQEQQQRQQQRHLRSRIVGGTDVVAGQYPFFGFWYGGDCGATLIHDDVFLTAAHCVDIRGGGSNGALGEIVLNTNQQPNNFLVESVAIHPDYNQNPDEPKWDFALLKIRDTVPNTVAVPVALNTDTEYLTTATESALLTTMGYGAMREGSYEWADILQEVTVAYIPTFPQCLRSYSNDILDAEICAGNYFRGGQDACQGTYLVSSGPKKEVLKTWFV